MIINKYYNDNQYISWFDIKHTGTSQIIYYSGYCIIKNIL